MNDTFVIDTLRDLLDAGFSRGQIARHIGVTTGAVCRWLSGEHHPTGHHTFRLARLHRALTGEAA